MSVSLIILTHSSFTAILKPIRCYKNVQTTDVNKSWTKNKFYYKIYFDKTYLNNPGEKEMNSSKKANIPLELNQQLPKSKT